MTYSRLGGCDRSDARTWTDARRRAGSRLRGCRLRRFAAGNVALIQRGGCTFKIKATNAQAAGASAVVIYNNIDGALNGTLGSGPGRTSR